jgi:hypothetical protein
MEFEELARTLQEEKVVLSVLSKQGNTIISLIIFENK